MTAWTARFLRVMLIIAIVAITGGVALTATMLKSRRTQATTVIEQHQYGGVPADGRPLDSGRVLAALDSTLEPETKCSVTELGLVRGVAVDTGSNVSVDLTVADQHYPYGYQLAGITLERLAAIPGVNQARVKIDPRAPWSRDLMSERAQQAYRRIFPLPPNRK